MHSDHYQATHRRILPTIASSLLNPDGGHSDQRNDPSASYNGCNNTFGVRSFAVAGPREWNDLPATLRNTDLTMDTFCKHLKTVLFTDSWGRGAFVTFWYHCAVYKCSYLLSTKHTTHFIVVFVKTGVVSYKWKMNRSLGSHSLVEGLKIGPPAPCRQSGPVVFACMVIEWIIIMHKLFGLKRSVLYGFVRL